MKVRYYKKRPVTVGVVRVPSLENQIDKARWQRYMNELAEWCGGQAKLLAASPHIAIPTLEGTMIASQGDYIIRGVNGEFYPCKPDIFAKTYEPEDWFELPAAQEDEDD